MAERTIGELTPATTIGPSDLLLMEQGGEAKSVSGQLLTEYIDRSMVGVEVNIVPSTQQGGGSYNTQTGVLTLNIPEGNGISGLSLVSQSGNEDTYRLTYEDGSYNTFVVTNGTGIASIAKTGTSGLTDTYTITLTNGNTTTFTVTNGAGGVSTVAGVAPGSGGDVNADSLAAVMRKVLHPTGITPTWTQDTSTYPEFPYRTDITVSGVTSDWFAEVVFDPDDTGDFAPVCQTVPGAVRIWCADNTRSSLTIPTIIVWR